MIRNFIKLFFFSFLLLTSYFTAAQTWTGSVSTDWNTASNWDPVGIPDYSSSVLIPGDGVTNWPVLANNIVVTFFFLRPGSQIDMKGFSVAVTAISLSSFQNETLVIDGSTIKNSATGTDIKFGSGGFVRIENSTFESNTTIDFHGHSDRVFGARLTEGSNHFKGNASFRENGNSTFFVSNTKSTYDGNLEVERTSLGLQPNYPSYDITSNLFNGGAEIKGNFKYTNTVGGTAFIGSQNMTSITGDAEVVISENLIITDKISFGGSGNARFIGSKGSNITQAGTQAFVLKNISIEKTEGSGLASSSSLKMAGKMSFVSGNLLTSESTVIFLNGATASGASDGSHVYGPAVKIGDEAFTFPIGSRTKLMPVSISAPGVGSDGFSAEYFDFSPTSQGYNTSSKAGTLTNLYNSGYWGIQRTSGNSNVMVSLGYNLLAGNVTDQGKLRVAHWNGSIWEDLGNGGNSGSLTVGTVTTEAGVASFSPFTIASSDASNPLPVKLIRFSVKRESETALLQWSTSEESNSDRFEIERSANAIEWQKLGQVKALGETNSLAEYQFTDREPTVVLNYYRLKMIDLDGTFSYSKIESLKIGFGTQTVIYPNPTTNRLLAKIPNGVNIESMELENTMGSNVLSLNAADSAYGIDVSKLPLGIYFLKLTMFGGQKETHMVYVNR